MRLDQMPRGLAGTIDTIDWAGLPAHEARRMRELGFDEGVAVAKLHAGPLGADPIAVKVGRMIIALRRAQAAHVTVAVADIAIAAE